MGSGKRRQGTIIFDRAMEPGFIDALDAAQAGGAFPRQAGFLL